jgi:DNA-binding MarR family transcriptional regulator
VTNRQWLLLAVIDKAFPGSPPTLAEAAAVYGSSRQNVKQVADQLVARGYLNIEPDERDRRAVRLVPTAKKALFDAPDVRRQQAQALADMFAAFTISETRMFRDLVLRAITHLATSGADNG